jgi:glyoxalase family protein
VLDRTYFRSVYFREPGGVLFEVATDGPGFTVDESVAELGTSLKLPARYEPIRERVAGALPPLLLPPALQRAPADPWP